MPDTGFFGNLAKSDRKEIGFPVCMTACPRPGIIDFMIDHENLCTFVINYPGGSRHMGKLVFPEKSILIFRKKAENVFFICLFLFIPWSIL